MTFDELRDANPELRFALYATGDDGLVTLEIYTPDEQVFSFVGRTAEEAIDIAFPPEPNLFD